MHIIGAGGHAKVVVDIILSSKKTVLGIWDENKLVSSFLNFRISGSLEMFKTEQSNRYIIAIGNNRIRKKIASQLIEPVDVAIHFSSVISTETYIGNGTVVMSNSSIGIGSRIGKHVIINTNASVDHDCVIGDFVHVSPQTGLAGNVEVGEGSHIGIGACVIQNIKIGKWATIGAGTVVVKDVPDFAVVVGNPGKIIKYNNINEQ